MIRFLGRYRVPLPLRILAGAGAIAAFAALPFLIGSGSMLSSIGVGVAGLFASCVAAFGRWQVTARVERGDAPNNSLKRTDQSLRD